jgi:light-regulated signal transduction histidine kinase (bacteriophytochrome)
MAVFAIASMFGRELPDLRHGNLPVFATDNLSRIAPVTEAVKDQAAGVLAISLSDDVQSLLLWFRREQIVHATWAGNPAAVDRDYAPGRANPRGSFAAWKEDIRNLSRPWAIEDVETAHDLLCAIRGADCIAEAADVPPIAAANVVPVRMAARAAPVPQASHAPRRVIRVGQL